jgi:hypothetical protein
MHGNQNNDLFVFIVSHPLPLYEISIGKLRSKPVTSKAALTFLCSFEIAIFTSIRITIHKVTSIFVMHARMYPKVSGLAAWSENCKWYCSLPVGAVVSLFCESV